MKKTKIYKAQPIIANYFNNCATKIFKPKELFKEFKTNKEAWGLAKSTSINSFIEYLIENSKLKRLEFPFPNRHETRFTWGNISILEVLLTIQIPSYLSHHTAMHLHGLTNNLPNTIHLNHEQIPRPQGGALNQKSIDMAFQNRPRASNNKIDFENIIICQINGMHTNQLGVISKSVVWEGSKVNIRMTNIERTLIDIAVRPVYSGGIDAIKLAYKLAKNKVSVQAMKELFLKLKFQYPYHQAIGFYLEEAGYPPSSIDLFKTLPMDFDFYLTYGVKELTYIKKWKLYIPKVSD